ncbi:hypothetical protein [Hyphomicrobium sp. CS1GBMeth3]|uniref:hypothetical protein n=1 Tax=Hyphomicrobium sp. CS1GBMeth3 TaxID=1892845 RepID=UPI000B15F280|nr:hypothetical protein [Hyphomicrobium sp. CS1GBMeth3]
MTVMDIRNGAETNDLGVSETEERLGIVGLLAITYKRMTLVIAEDDEGLMATGWNCPWPGQENRPHYGLAMARQKAIDGLLHARARRTEFLAKGTRQ